MKLLILVLLYLSNVFATCPAGALSYNSMCYKYVKDSASFVDAEISCNGNGGHLASVQNGFINAEIRSQANIFFSCTSQSDYWLGGDTYINSTWSWTDGTTWNYVNWAPGQGSSTPSPQCLSATISDGRWYSSSCDVMKAYVCAMPEATPTCPSVAPQVPATSCPSCPLPTPPCDDEWIHFRGTGYCYTVLHNLDFWSAENKCKTMGAHLASIHSQVENNFIQRISMSGEPQEDGGISYVWIGLNLQNNQWGWTDGTDFDFQMWYSDQPKTGFTCGFFVPDFSDTSLVDKWFANGPCSNVFRAFVCKKKGAY